MRNTEKNIEPYKLNNLPEDRKKEIQSMGTKAAAAARKRRKSLKEAADLFLSLPVKKDSDLYEKLKDNGLKKDDIDYQMAIIVELALQAAKGNTRAAKIIFDLVGVDVAQQDRSVTIVDDL